MKIQPDVIIMNEKKITKIKNKLQKERIKIKNKRAVFGKWL